MMTGQEWKAAEISQSLLSIILSEELDNRIIILTSRLPASSAHMQINVHNSFLLLATLEVPWFRLQMTVSGLGV